MKRFWIACICLVVSPNSGAQSPQPPAEYVIQNWTTDVGLPQNMITAITQTDDGFLWVGTRCGLAKFDGLRFTPFLPGKIHELGDGRISALCGARDGGLWIGTEDGRLFLFKNGRFSENLIPPGKLNANDGLLNIVGSQEDGGVYFSLASGGVGRLHRGQLEIRSKRGDWPERGPSQVKAGPSGGVWVTSASRCGMLVADEYRPIVKGGDVSVERFLCPGQRGGYWLLAGNKVRLYQDGGWVGGSHPVAPRMGVLMDALEDQSGFLWLATSRDGVFRFDSNGNVLHINREAGLPDDTICRLFEDREGNIWAGTYGRGLVRLRPALFRAYGRAQGLASDHVTGVCTDGNARAWITTADNGLHVMEEGKIREFLPGSRNGLAAVVVDPVVGVRVIDRTDGILVAEPGGFRRAGGPRPGGGDFTGMFRGNDGTLWTCGDFMDKLSGMKDQTLVSIAFPAGMSRVSVCSMASSQDGTLWIGTASDGVLRHRNGEWTRIAPGDKVITSTPAWCLLPDRDGSLWIGTKGSGIMRWKDGILGVCDDRDGLADTVIGGILEDESENFWCASRRGIFRVAKKDLEHRMSGGKNLVRCASYGRSDGLPTLDCSGGYHPGVHKDANGLLYFPTWSGLVVVDPSKVPVNHLPPKVHLERVLVNGVPEELDGAELDLPHTTRNIGFEFTGVSFMAPEAVRFRTRLSGWGDQEWKEIGGRSDIAYENLPPGSYVFEVTACNRDGVSSASAARLGFTIHAAVWQTVWFKIFCAVAAGACLLWFGRTGARRKYRERIALLEKTQAVERERHRIARDIHDSLGARASQIGFLAEMSEPTPARIASIRETARDLARSLDETVWLVNPRCDTLGQFGEYLIHHTEEVMRPANIECRFGLDTLPEVPLSADVRHNLFLACKEALCNVLKHSAASRVELDISAQDEILSIVIRDNGSGFDPERAAGSSRLGLENMKHRMEQVGGTFRLESSDSSGTVVILRLPLARRA